MSPTLTPPAVLVLLVCCGCGSDPVATAGAASGSSSDSAPFAPVDPPAGDGALGINLTSAGVAVLASWVEPAGDDKRVRFAVFDVASHRWGAASTVVEGRDVLANSVELPTATRSAGGAYFVTFLRRGDGPEASSVHLATSIDGASWRLLGPVHDDGTDTEHAHASVLAEGAGVRLAWLDGRARLDGGAMALRSALFDDTGARVTDDILDERVCDCCQTAAALTAAGPIVVYRDRTADERRDLAIVRHVDGRWSTPVDVAVDGWTIRGCPVNGPQVAAVGQRVVVGWYTEGGASRVRVAFSDDAGAHFDPAIDLDGPRPLGRVDVEWLDDGTALVAWLGVPARTSDAWVLLRRVGRDRRVGAVLELASIGATSAFGAPALSRVGSDVLVAWSESGEPRHVRAAFVRGSGVPGLGGVPTVEVLAPPAPGTVGEVPADFTLRTLDGAEASLHSFRGRPLLLSVFATWCEACRAELPLLVSIAREHGDALAVVGVSIDEGDPSSVASFLQAHGVTYPVLLDPAARAAGGALDVPPIPATFLLDPSGRIAYAHHAGDAPLEANLRDAIARALGAREGEHAHEH